MSNVTYINALGIVNPLGVGKKQVAQNLFAGSQAGMVERDDLVLDRSVWVGAVHATLPEIPSSMHKHNTRNNRLMLMALHEIEDDILAAIERFGSDRVGVILGSSTSGISDAETGITFKVENGNFPDEYDYAYQEIDSISDFVSNYYKLTGPAMTISTACTSSAKSLASAKRFINAGLCDAVIVGGADTLCGLTLNGFQSLNSLSSEICNPFSLNRDGINIGEGAVAFIISKDEGAVCIRGIGESSDAHHFSAPDPTGSGAIKAMESALCYADISSKQISYLNLHGTATLLNDAMEGRAVSQVFGREVCCSSTKPMTGHMLGAAGASEIAFLWMALQEDYAQRQLPPHLWDEEIDKDIPELGFVKAGDKQDAGSELMMTNSFAFGGNNISVILGKG